MESNGSTAKSTEVQRPTSGRKRPASAQAGDVEDEEWLFYAKESITTAQISRAGFTNVVIFDASRWRGSDPSVASDKPAEVAAQDLTYTLALPENIPALTS